MLSFKKKVASALVAASVVLVPMTPAMARNHNYDRAYGYDRGYAYNNGYNDGRYYQNRDYDRRGYNDRRYYRNERCRSSGTTGTIIGAIAGGLLGREVVGRRGDRTAGLIVGGAAGALAGRAIDRSDDRRC